MIITTTPSIEGQKITQYHGIVVGVALAVAMLAGGVSGAAKADTAQPYAGQQGREIRALDPIYVEGLRKGAGLGFAKSAELNGWPGPLHVLELAEELDLTDAQRSDVSAIRAEMLSETVPLGEALIEAERRLEMLFAGTPERADLMAATREIAALRAELRTAHLAAHLKTTPLLSRHQKMIYARERGYADGANHTHGGAHQ